MFTYENEVRILFKHQSAAEDHTKEILGHGLEWNPETALQNIYVHPDADYSFMETVSGVVERYAPGLKNCIWWSKMQSRPPF